MLTLSSWKCGFSRALGGVSILRLSNYKQVFSSDVSRLYTGPHNLFSLLAYCLSLVVICEKSELRSLMDLFYCKWYELMHIWSMWIGWYLYLLSVVLQGTPDSFLDLITSHSDVSTQLEAF